jgi:hypothetical protein
MNTNISRILTIPTLAMLFTGCMTPDEADPEVGTTSEELGLAPGAFIHQHVVSGFNCPSNEVMIGIHEGNSKVICAGLNHGYRVKIRYNDNTDFNGGPNTQVSYSPTMHGCAPNYFIQGLGHGYTGEDLVCVSLETADGVALNYSSTLHDGRGSTVIASVPTYGLTPNMHVCPVDFAMAGYHKNQNDLYCAN